MVGLSAEIIGAFRLWHFLIVVGVVSFLLGVVGEWQGMFKIEEDFRIIAIMGGFFFSGYAGVMAWLKPLERNGKKSAPTITISPQQMAFCAQFDEWTSFDDAAQAPGPDDDEKVAEKTVKIKQLRIEIGTSQGILDRKIENGLHMVRYHKAGDRTTFAGSK